MIGILVRSISNLGVREGMPAFAVLKRMAFNWVNLFILLVSISGLLQALFSNDYFFRRNVLLSGTLIFCTSLMQAIFMRRGRFWDLINISFLLYPPLLVLFSIATREIIIQFNIILLCVLAFFIFFNKRNILIFFCYFMLCFVAGNFWYLHTTGTNYLPTLLIIISAFLILYAVLNFLRSQFLEYRQDVKNNFRAISIQKSEIEAQKKELEAKLKRLTELNRSKTVMISALLHDFKDNIYCLHRSLKIAESSENGQDFFKEALPLLKENSDDTIKLLESLLNWGKTLLSSTQAVFSEVDINCLLRSTISFKSEMMEQKNIGIRFEAEKNLFVTADRNMLEIVFRNILANAIKFSSPGYPISIFTEKKNDLIHISIIDYGVGMDESEVNMLLKGKIFTTPGTFNEKGTGIGLLLSKELLEKNAGTLAISGKVKTGTKVEIVLPACKTNSE